MMLVLPFTHLVSLLRKLARLFGGATPPWHGGISPSILAALTLMKPAQPKFE
jgi:hypothetical protein